jgi:hypothetical protein|tara:strand:+ start:3350 stop:3925 length:576 start_codon:yes stop_codon:yes gene_type:complete
MAKKTNWQKPNVFGENDPIAEGIHHAIKGLDEMAVSMEMKWGCERLPALVSPETAAKFGSAKAKLDMALNENDPEAVRRRAAVMLKGWRVMDVEAAERGHKALSPKIWPHTTQEGFKYAVARSSADAIKAIRTLPELEGVAVYSIEEIGLLLEADSMALVNEAKEHFPGAAVSRVKKKTRPAQLFDDEVPF